MKRLPIMLVAVMLILIILPGWAGAAPHNEIYASLKSPGHSGETLDKCNGSESEQLRQEIRQKLAAGQSKEEIIAYYVGIYGEEILAVPTKKGFDLTAWIVPPLAVIGGIILVYLVLSRWVRNHKARGAAVNTTGPGIDAVDEERLNEEIRKYL